MFPVALDDAGSCGAFLRRVARGSWGGGGHPPNTTPPPETLFSTLLSAAGQAGEERG
jgi:hypothetical protein